MTFYDKTGIEHDAIDKHRRLIDAFERTRNPRGITARDRAILASSNRDALLAVNQFSRRLWGQAICRPLSAHFCADFNRSVQNQKIYLLTIVDVACATAASPSAINIKLIRRKLRSGLNDLSFLGFIEPAFYVNVQAGARVKDKRCVFWHLHALLWNLSKNDVQRLVRVLNADGRYQAIAGDVLPVQAKLISPGELPATVGYIMKMPGNAYRLWRRRWDRCGRPLDKASHSFGQSKAQLRPGERVALFHAMRHLRLDDLVLSGGEGAPLLARAKHELKRQLNSQSPRHRQLARRSATRKR